MLKHIILHEIQCNIISFRLHVTFILTALIFMMGTIAYIQKHKTEVEQYREDHSAFIEQLRIASEKNLSNLATGRWNFFLGPRANEYISDARDKYYPNTFEYSAYNVYGYNLNPGDENPYLQTFQELNWEFIIAFIISFTVLLFTFDAVSGEKESHTLLLIISNSLSRGTLLAGKFLSSVITALLVIVPGMCVSLLILLITGTVHLTVYTLTELCGFLAIVALFVACVAAFGLFTSIIARKSNVSLLITLSLWLFFILVIPNSAVFLAKKLYPVEKIENLLTNIEKADQELRKNAPPGSFASSDDPFLPQHRLRADIQTKLLNSYMQLVSVYNQKIFRQYEFTRMLTYLSPVSLFEYSSESLVGGGYLRFQKTWNDLHAYQTQLLTFFKAKDAADPASPHWYNPYESFSTTNKPAKFEEVPQFQEKVISIGERLSFAKIYLLVMILYTAVIFFLTYVLFVKYDVR